MALLVSHDRNAADHCGLVELVEGLPRGICCITDAAYEPSEHMVPVYQGLDKLSPKYNNFNFYASQCRIRVEMAFGLMTSKWGILQRPSGVSLYNVKWMIQAIGRLHNFIINERLMYDALQEDDRMTEAVAQGRGFLPSTPHTADGDPVDLDPLFNHESMTHFRGFSELREAMADRVQRMGLTRPVGNRLRQQEEDKDAS